VLFSSLDATGHSRGSPCPALYPCPASRRILAAEAGPGQDSHPTADNARRLRHTCGWPYSPHEISGLEFLNPHILEPNGDVFIVVRKTEISPVKLLRGRLVGIFVHQPRLHPGPPLIVYSTELIHDFGMFSDNVFSFAGVSTEVVKLPVIHQSESFVLD